MSLFKTFKGRLRELRLLDDLWAAPEAALLILYGRRRVGKPTSTNYPYRSDAFA